MTAVPASPASSPFAQAGPGLIAMGYSPLSILPADHPHRAAGKAPANLMGGSWRPTEGWQALRTAPLTGFPLRLALNAPGRPNIGIVMGTPAGPNAAGAPTYVVAVDVDTQDSEAFDAILRALPASPMKKKGAKGLTAFYRATDAIKSRSFDDHRIPRGSGQSRRLLDLLTGFATKQTICPPSIHPETRQPYVWLDGPVPACDLPELTEDALAALIETLEMHGFDPNAGRTEGAERKPFDPADHDADDPFERAKVAAMANLSAWVPALANLHGLRPARGGYEAVDLTRDSSSGRPTEKRKRNLSIQSAGIKDFGTNETFSAIDLVMRLNGLTESGALGFLEYRLGLSDDSVVVDVAALTAAHEDRDLPEPLRRKSGEAVARAVETVVPVNRRGQQASVAPTEIPPHLLRCPGLVGEITDYIIATARKPQPVLSLAAALTVVGTCAGRKYSGPTYSGTHLFALLLAKSGASKDHPLDMAARLLTAADLTRHIGKGEFMSHQAVFRSLSQEPLSLNPIDEMGAFLKRINKRSSGGNEQAITGVLRTIWGKSFKMLPPPGWATQGMDPVFSPALSILGASTHEDFFRAIEAGDTDNGFLNRFIIFSTQRRPAVQKPTADIFEVPAVIVSRMVSIYQAGGNPLANATLHMARCDKPLVVVQWDGGEDGALNAEYLAWAETLDEASDAESFFARTAEMAIRLATIRAIGCNPSNPVIDRECFAWAQELAMWCAGRMVADAAEFMAENQTQADRSRVLRVIRKNSPITHRDLLRKLTTFKSRELEDILKGLEAAELIRVDTGPAATNHKRPKVYTWLGDVG